MTNITKEDKKGVKGSLMVKGRKSIAYLQQLKDEGTPIVQMCPAIRDQFWVMAAEMANCDVCRLTVPGDGTASMEWQSHIAEWWIRIVRNAAKLIHINFYMNTIDYASKEKAVEIGSKYMSAGATPCFPWASATKS